ncbi:GmrSD restriction endonuclease domain-containing protein [Jongsikchunia kroppenstedtii]|uniref:GmrSD restriction endonuclease domain-containing protein n=1 Tax=Jongsikchunia kroppenstedtii TaxID=1121721 RepID=UPI00037D0579|nr:DUF1524 domain-containing protein [Jongsikchunia kroppenstedtii]
MTIATIIAAVGGCTPHVPTRTAGTGASTTSAEFSSVTTQSSTPARTSDVPGAIDRQALTAAAVGLAALAVKGRAPKTGYSRDQFGPSWSDDVNVQFGHNGCDTRNDILLRDLTAVAVKPGTRNCVVLSGTLQDPYSGSTIAFQRGTATSAAVQIDHIVPLSDAWQTGAQQLTADQRRDLANDPRNLQATDGKLNDQKSDGDAATWLPPNKAYRCLYVARQVDVKRAYGLWVTLAERDAIARVLQSCGAAADTETTAAQEDMSTYTSPPAITATTDAPAPVAPAMGPGGSAYYPNCAAARAAGAAPLYRGDPGYRTGLDGDGDGVACEPKRR